jgi:hypothetical protein
MFKRLSTIFALTAAMALAAAASTIDGHWTAQIQTKNRTANFVFDLQANGNQLTGKVTRGGPHARPTDIENGTFDGTNFSFATERQTKEGVVKILWQGTASSDQLQGTRTRDGAKHGLSFTAKRGDAAPQTDSSAR